MVHAYHLAVFINGCDGTYLLVAAAWPTPNGVVVVLAPLRTFTSQDGSADHDAVANQGTGLQRLAVVDLSGRRSTPTWCVQFFYSAHGTDLRQLGGQLLFCSKVSWILTVSAVQPAASEAALQISSVAAVSEFFPVASLAPVVPGSFILQQ